MSLNKVILIGNVGSDPETRYLDNDKSVARFSLATSESYRTREGEKITNTEWHNIVVWNNLAKIVEKYVKKGSQLCVEGKVKYRSYEDKDGVKRYVTEIVCDNLVMIGGKKDEEQQNASAPRQVNEPNNNSDEDPNDLPFLM